MTAESSTWNIEPGLVLHHPETRPGRDLQQFAPSNCLILQWCTMFRY